MAVYNYIISFGIPGDANSGVTFENINKKGGFYQMKKKLLSALLVAAMAVSTLAGCGSSTTETPAADTTTEAADTDAAADTTDDAAEATDTEVASGDKVNINIYRATYNLGQPDSAEVQKVQDAINEYIADKINVQVTINDIPSGEYADKANLALANNEINLLWTASWMGTIGTNDLYKANAAYDITDLLPGTTLYSAMPESIWTASRYDGKDLFVPVYKEAYEGYDLKFPEGYATEFGLDTASIKELKDLEPYLEWCKTEKGLKYPYLVGKTPMFFRYYIDKYDFFDGANSLFAVDRATDTVVNPTLTQDYIDFCTLMCEWGEKGYISEDEVTKTTSDSECQTQNWGVNWWTCVPGDESNSESRDLQEEVFVEGFTGKYAHSTTTLGSCFAITANSTEEQAKACIDFLGLLYTDTTVADLYTYGIEGEDYTLDADGKVVANNEKYSHSAWESTSVVPLTLCAGEPDDKVQIYQDMNGQAKASCAAGFRFNVAPVEAQYAACTNVFDQYGFVLELGGYAASDVESIITEYNAALDEAGYQDVLAEFSKQYEDWKASK